MFQRRQLTHPEVEVKRVLGVISEEESDTLPWSEYSFEYMGCCVGFVAVTKTAKKTSVTTRTCFPVVDNDWDRLVDINT